ncbi:MAG TPA: hypothetical protein VKP66_04790 [Steroidobacteraceae bacterium]|nr:hypothetical protein [Steroidobacteraceae bacterium]
MILRKLVLATATIATLAPAISNASPERTSAKACASAFASTIVAPGTTPAYKMSYRGATNSILTDFYPSDFTFTLEARDPKTGLSIARAVCSTDSHGTVTAISAVPLNDAGKLASRTF